MASNGWGWAAGLGAVLLLGLFSSDRNDHRTTSDETMVTAYTMEAVDSSIEEADAMIAAVDAAAADTDSTLDQLEIKGGETYAEYDARRDALRGVAGTYGGDGCTVDCSGHEAGREWAERRGVTDESECGGNSWSFREGCATYAREQSSSGWGNEDSGAEDEGESEYL